MGFKIKVSIIGHDCVFQLVINGFKDIPSFFFYKMIYALI